MNNDGSKINERGHGSPLLLKVEALEHNDSYHLCVIVSYPDFKMHILTPSSSHQPAIQSTNFLHSTAYISLSIWFSATCSRYTYTALKDPFWAYFFHDILPNKEISKIDYRKGKIDFRNSKIYYRNTNKS